MSRKKSRMPISHMQRSCADLADAWKQGERGIVVETCLEMIRDVTPTDAYRHALMLAATLLAKYRADWPSAGPEYAVRAMADLCSELDGMEPIER